MADYKTPGVYVLEKDSFGSSIVANETAIPVFIGFTEKAVGSNGLEMNYMKGSSYVREPLLVSSIMEYQTAFGGADLTGLISVVAVFDSITNKMKYVATNKKDVAGTIGNYTPGLMHPSVRNYFSNGGGSCFIISIGNYNDFTLTSTAPVEMDYICAAIEQAEETTLIVPTDLIRYGDENYYNWGSIFTDFAGSGDKIKYFCVLDVIQSNPLSSVYNEGDVTAYREGVVSSQPSFVAAYFPYLKSLSSYAYNPDMTGVMLNGFNIGTSTIVDYFFSGIGLDANENELYTFTYYESSATGNLPVVTLVAGGASNAIAVAANTMTVTFMTGATADDLNAVWATVAATFPQWSITFLMAPAVAASTNLVQDGEWATTATAAVFPITITFTELTASTGNALSAMNCQLITDNTVTETTVNYTPGSFIITCLPNQTAAEIVGEYVANADDGFTMAATAPNSQDIIAAVAAVSVPLAYVDPNNAIVEDVKAFLAINYINMPPSPYMVGIYSKLDNSSGVWTPPANIAPVGVRGPAVTITSKQQENMNVDAKAGKSVNAIRAFTGKGTLVWGARTNNGNSMDWRYINVRRLFNSMERDISIALEAYVFKPNVHNTWVEVKTSIESYLYGLYLSGAFAGTTPATSYQVLIGLGETMTDEDVLNGYMRVSIMVAPVRPAEFIVLTFSQMVGQ